MFKKVIKITLIVVVIVAALGLYIFAALSEGGRFDVDGPEVDGIVFDGQ